MGSSEGRGPPADEAALGAKPVEGRSLKLLLSGLDSASGPAGAAPALHSTAVPAQSKDPRCLIHVISLPGELVMAGGCQMPECTLEGMLLSLASVGRSCSSHPRTGGQRHLRTAVWHLG